MIRWQAHGLQKLTKPALLLMLGQKASAVDRRQLLPTAARDSARLIMRSYGRLSATHSAAETASMVGLYRLAIRFVKRCRAWR